MARFYMHRRTGAHLIRDLEGYDYSSLQHMRAEAVLAAREAMATAIQQGRFPDFNESFEITDAAGEMLLKVRFSESLDGNSAPEDPRQPGY